MWDILDNPPTDGDGIEDVDLSDFVGALRDYQWTCAPSALLDNRCAFEGWPWPVIHLPLDANGPNWKDFKFWLANSPNVTAAELNAVETLNRMTGSDNG